MVSGLLLSLSLLASSAVAAAAPWQPSGQTHHGKPQKKSWIKGKAFDRIAIVWLENTDYDLAAGDPNLKALAEKGITLTNYFAVTHPSQPNYVAAIGGDYFGINHDALTHLPSNISSVVDLLEAKGITWGEYQEDMPYTGFQGFEYKNQVTGANDYVRKHNPAIIYDSVANSADRLAKIKNLTLFYEDLKADNLPQWMFITPNMTSDGHDTSVTVAGTWTSNFLEPLLNDERFMKNTLVLVTFDENHTYSQQNKVLAILLGDAVPKHLVGTTDSAYYNHYSEISTVQANWDLDTLGRWDVGANVFQLVAETTGDHLRQWAGKVPLSQMFFNQSYPGPDNNVNSSVPWPVPNTKLEYAGRKVYKGVVQTWQKLVSQSAYTSALEIPDGQHPDAEFSKA